MLEQPLPLLYPTLKRAFLEQLPPDPRRELAYPSNDALGPNAFDLDELTRFATSYEFAPERISSEIRDRGYSGHRFHVQDPGAIEAALEGLRLADVLAAHESVLADERIVGMKEVTAEELAPWILASGRQVVVVIRDPRDTYASQVGGAGSEFGGRARPLLLVSRIWRKLVAIAAQVATHPRGVVLRYEDLVTAPVAMAGALLEQLGYEDASVRMLDGAAGQDPNSSYAGARGISTASIGRYREVIPEDRATAIGAICSNELEALGYPVPDQSLEEVLERGWEEVLARPELDHWALGAERRAEELTRRGAWHPSDALSWMQPDLQALRGSLLRPRTD